MEYSAFQPTLHDDAHLEREALAAAGVAVWTPLYTSWCPLAPRKALIATIASVASVPIVIGWMIATGRTVYRPTPIEFFFASVFPYLLIVILSYAGQCPPGRHQAVAAVAR